LTALSREKHEITERSVLQIACRGHPIEHIAKHLDMNVNLVQGTGEPRNSQWPNGALSSDQRYAKSRPLARVQQRFPGQMDLFEANLLTPWTSRSRQSAHCGRPQSVGAGAHKLAETSRHLVAMSTMLRKAHKYPLLLPKNTLPNWLVMAFGPCWGLSRDYMRKHLGFRFKINDTRSIEELGITYRPIEETLITIIGAGRSLGTRVIDTATNLSDLSSGASNRRSFEPYDALKPVPSASRC
jgi:hypothetical protein